MAPSDDASGDADPHQWGMNKKKRVALGDPVVDPAGDVELVPDSMPSLKETQGMSWKETLLGQDSMQTDYYEENFASDDYEKDGKEDPDCPAIYLTKKEKAAWRKSGRQSLIIKVMGRGVGFMYLLNRIKSLWKPKTEIEMIALENDYFLMKFN